MAGIEIRLEQRLPDFAKQLDPIKEIDRILRPYIESLELDVQVIRHIHNSQVNVVFNWKWNFHTVHEVQSIKTAHPSGDPFIPSIRSEVRNGGKYHHFINLTEEFASDNPIDACATKLYDCLELAKLSIVEAITNKYLGNEVHFQ